MMISISKLRQDIYRILDQVLETGVPVEIERHGNVLRIEPLASTSKIARLRPRDYLKTDPDEIVHLDWSGDWKP